jgi:hypothetical protein
MWKRALFLTVILGIGAVWTQRERWLPKLMRSPTEIREEEDGWDTSRWLKEDNKMMVPDAPIDLDMFCARGNCGGLDKEREW